MAFNFGHSLSFLFILFIFLLFYFVKPKLLIKTNIYFLFILISEIFNVIFELITQGGEFSHVSYSRHIFIILECIFAFVYLARSLFLFLFLLSTYQVRLSKTRKIILGFVFFIFAILIIISSAIFIFDLTNKLLIFATYTIAPCLLFVMGLHHNCTFLNLPEPRQLHRFKNRLFYSPCIS